MNQLFLRKLLVAFVIGFLGVVLQKISNVGPQADLSTLNTLWHSVISGAFFAGLRAALVLIPGVNLVPSDAQSPLAPPTTPVAGK